MSDIELLGCPFDGGDAHIVYDGPPKEQVQHAISWGHDLDGGWYRAQCKQCGASVGEFRKSREAIAAWNRRASDPLAAELVGAVKAVRVYVQDCIENGHDRTMLGNMYGARDEIDALLAKVKKQEEGRSLHADDGKQPV